MQKALYNLNSKDNLQICSSNSTAWQWFYSQLFQANINKETTMSRLMIKSQAPLIWTMIQIWSKEILNKWGHGKKNCNCVLIYSCYLCEYSVHRRSKLSRSCCFLFKYKTSNNSFILSKLLHSYFFHYILEYFILRNELSIAYIDPWCVPCIKIINLLDALCGMSHMCPHLSKHVTCGPLSIQIRQAGRYFGAQKAKRMEDNKKLGSKPNWNVRRRK